MLESASIGKVMVNIDAIIPANSILAWLCESGEVGMFKPCTSGLLVVVSGVAFNTLSSRPPSKDLIECGPVYVLASTSVWSVVATVTSGNPMLGGSTPFRRPSILGNLPGIASCLWLPKCFPNFGAIPRVSAIELELLDEEIGIEALVMGMEDCLSAVAVEVMPGWLDGLLYLAIEWNISGDMFGSVLWGSKVL